jgi:hypothetical protein
LPLDVTRHILWYVTRERDRVSVKGDHSDLEYIVYVYEEDLKNMGVLRATNKQQPFRTYLTGNRMTYYELVQDLWRMRKLLQFRRILIAGVYVTRNQLHCIYEQMWYALNDEAHAIRAAVDEDPEALLRALKALREKERCNPLHHSKFPPCDS